MISLLRHIFRQIDVRFFVWGAAFVLFCLQALYLHQAAMPSTDESLYTEAGRMIMAGYVPFRDFSHPHAPILAVFSGVIQWATGSLYPVRLLFLAINCLSIVALFAVLRSITKSTLAALVGIGFYMAFHEMLHHDFRFLAVRQFANAFFVFFLYCTFVLRPSRLRTIARMILAPLTILIFLQNALYFLLLGIAHTLSQSSTKQRMAVLQEYCWLALCVIVVTTVFLLTVPSSWDLMFQSHLSVRPPIARSPRLSIAAKSPDGFFYVLSTVSLMITTLAIPRLRYYALAMLGMIFAVLLPREFWPHYFVGSAPAYAFGAATTIVILQEFIQKKYHWIPVLLVVGALGYQWSIAYPSLLTQWLHNRDVRYYDVIDQLRLLPEPVLTFIEPVYLAQANKRGVYHYYQPEWRMFQHFGKRLTDEEFAELTDEACTILVSGLDHGFVPKHILSQWEKDYTEIPVNGPEQIFLTRNAGCAQRTYPPK